MHINRKKELKVPFVKVRAAKVFKAQDDNVYMKLAKDKGDGNCVDLSTGEVTTIMDFDVVTIIKAELNIE